MATEISRIGHLSDIHAGYRAYRHVDGNDVNLRELDGYRALHQMVGQIIDSDVDVVFIAGDVFHTPKPSIRAITVVQNELRRLANEGISVYMLAGNHDANDVKSDIAASKVLDDKSRGIFSHVEPYVKYEVDDGIFLHMVSHHMYSQQGETMRKVVPVDGAINILTTHGSIIDPLLEHKLSVHHSPREIIIPDAMLEDSKWDYKMLGHIHERGWVASKKSTTDSNGHRIYYNGSLIRRGWADAEGEMGRGWTEWVIYDDGSMTPIVHNVDQRPQFDFVSLDASTMHAEEVEDRLISRLRKTRKMLDLDGFDSLNSPILRQKVLGLTKNKENEIDWQAVAEEASFALDWDVNKERVINAHSSASTDVQVSSDGRIISDVSASYDKWIESNDEMFTDCDETMKRNAIEDSRRFISEAQAQMLEDANG